MSSISESLYELLGQFNIVESTVVPGSANSMVSLCPANPLRWGLVISAPIVTNSGLPAPSWIRTQQTLPSLFAGIPLGQGNGWKEFDFRDFGALVQQQWFGAVSGSAGLGSWHVLEVLIQQ